MIALLGLTTFIPASRSFAKGAPLVKTTLITGTAAECGAGIRNGWVHRPLIIKLHESPSGRVMAIYTVEPTSGVGSYAFRVTPGDYYLTVSESTSVPSSRNIVVRSNSKEIVAVDIATTCQ